MSNHTERIGINHCAEIAERNKWMFREQPIDDIGIDAHMEITEPTGEPKQLIALQIKSGASWFKEKKDGCIIFRSINERQYNYWFPFTSYTDVFPKLFPWASFSADEDFFEEDDKYHWHEYNCYYDKEDDEWLIVGEPFEEFRKKLNPMRSIIHSGEVAEYMMILSLNELGKAFLSVENFVSKKQPYVETRPEGESEE